MEKRRSTCQDHGKDLNAANKAPLKAVNILQNLILAKVQGDEYGKVHEDGEEVEEWWKKIPIIRRLSED
jgi:hypothetical protein